MFFCACAGIAFRVCRTARELVSQSPPHDVSRVPRPGRSVVRWSGIDVADAKPGRRVNRFAARAREHNVFSRESAPVTRLTNALQTLGKCFAGP